MRFFVCTVTLAVAGLVTGATASASVVFDVNADLQYGGTITGSFTTNNALNTITSYDIFASAGIGSAGYTFGGYTYDPSDSTVTAESSTLIQFDSTTGEELRLTFSAPLSVNGAKLTTASYESESSAGNRTAASGSVIPAELAGAQAMTGVPEPASLALLATILVPAALIYKRRRGPGTDIR